MVRAPLAIAAVLALGLGCSDDCHDIGCSASLVVELAPESGFADGAYEVTLVTPEGTSSCSFAIAGSIATKLTCSGEDTVQSGELPRYMLIYSYAMPETLRVTVTLEGTTLAEQEFTPEYTDVVVDAQACGGPCQAAQVSVAL